MRCLQLGVWSRVTRLLQDAEAIPTAGLSAMDCVPLGRSLRGLLYCRTSRETTTSAFFDYIAANHGQEPSQGDAHCHDIFSSAQNALASFLGPSTGASLSCTLRLLKARLCSYQLPNRITQPFIIILSLSSHCWLLPCTLPAHILAPIPYPR